MIPDSEPSGFAAEELALRCYDDIYCVYDDYAHMPNAVPSHVAALRDVLDFFSDQLR